MGVKEWSCVIAGFVLGGAAMVPIVANAQSANSDSSEKFRPSQVATNKGVLTGKEIRVEGVLLNEGTNYFTDRRLTVKDSAAAPEPGLPVKLQLPTEVPPGPSGEQTSPPVLSQYLGKKVVLDGILKEDFIRGFGRTTVLEVQRLRPVD